MSLLVKQKETGRYLYYIKGAEVVMETKVKPNQRVPVQEYCEGLAMDGLRTLVIAQKVLTEDQVNNFLYSYQEASQKLKNREKSI
jgi:magnesium-transporting ATPase (P-type)